jgi:hypothetical protein
MKKILFGVGTLFFVLMTQGVAAQTQADNDRQRAETEMQRDIAEKVAWSTPDSHAPWSNSSNNYDNRNGIVSEKRERLRIKAFKEMQKPSQVDRELYKEFLDRSKTGIFRIFPARQDGEPVPSTFSFRDRKSPFADIRLKNSEIIARNFFAHSIMADLGNVPVESISLASTGVKFINEFAPSTDISDVNEKEAKLRAGINADEFRYASALELKTGNTYVLRVIAYKNNNSIADKADGRKYGRRDLGFPKILQEDERDDVTVAFKIVRRDIDGGVTIVWKELKRISAPAITFEFEEFEGEGAGPVISEAGNLKVTESEVVRKIQF